MKKFYFCAFDTLTVGLLTSFRMGIVEAQSEALAEICVEQFFLQGKTKEALAAEYLFVPRTIFLSPEASALHLNISLCINLQKD